MEKTVATSLAVSKTDEDESRKAHGGADSEVEVGSMCGNGNVCRRTIDGVVIEVQRIVPAKEIHCENSGEMPNEYYRLECTKRTA